MAKYQFQNLGAAVDFHDRKSDGSGNLTHLKIRTSTGEAMELEIETLAEAVIMGYLERIDEGGRKTS